MFSRCQNYVNYVEFDLYQSYDDLFFGPQGFFGMFVLIVVWSLKQEFYVHVLFLKGY